MNNRNQLLLLQIIIFIAFIAMTMPYPIIPTLFLSPSSAKASNFLLYHCSHQTQVSLILGAYPLGLFLGSYLLGSISDKRGKRLTLLWSLLLSSSAQVASGYLVTQGMAEMLLITRLLSGFFEGNIAIARASLSLLCETEDSKKKHFGRTNAALTLGWTIGPLIGSFFSSGKIGLVFNYGLPFYISGVLTFAVFIFAFLQFQEPASPIKENNNKTNNNLFTKKLVPLLICSLLMTLGIDAFYQFLPIYLAAEFPISPFSIGIGISIVAFTNTLTNVILIPVLEKFINTIKSITAFPILLALCLLIIAAIPFKYGIFIILPFVGIFIALTMTNMTVVLATNSSQFIQGKLMGLLTSQRTLGTALISFSMIPLLNLTYRAPFIIGGVLLFLGAYLIIYIKKYNTKFFLPLESDSNNKLFN